VYVNNTHQSSPGPDICAACLAGMCCCCLLDMIF
jgi:hypothetical protein